MHSVNSIGHQVRGPRDSLELRKHLRPLYLEKLRKPLARLLEVILQEHVDAVIDPCS